MRRRERLVCGPAPCCSAFGGSRFCSRFSVPDCVPGGRKRALLQHDDRRAEDTVQLHRAVYPVEPFQFAREQRRSRRGPVLDHLGVALIGDGEEGAAAGRSRSCLSMPSRGRSSWLATHAVRRLRARRVSRGDDVVERLGRIQVYLWRYMAVALLLSLWMLPGLVAALTPIKPVIGRDAATRSSRRSWPGTSSSCCRCSSTRARDLLEQHELVARTRPGLPDVIVPASFNFPIHGKAADA